MSREPPAHLKKMPKTVLQLDDGQAERRLRVNLCHRRLDCGCPRIKIDGGGSSRVRRW